MNYNAFTKAELIEAIKASGDSSYNIDGHLINLWGQKTEDLLNEIQKNNNEMSIALKNRNFERYYELINKSKELDKKYEKISKALD